LIDHKQYDALTTGAALYLPAEYGILSLTDKDRADFLQRMTTNDIAALEPGQSTVTVLTSPTARILYVFTVLCRANDLLLFPAEGQTHALAQHLRGQIFFMDAVKVNNLSPENVRCRLIGDQSETVLQSFGLDIALADEGTWQERDGLLAVKQHNYGVPGYDLMVSHEQQSVVMERLLAAGVTTIDPAAYHTRRVELGRPAVGHELTEDYSPLEAGLAWTCAENKGCYTGQEIIARQITYDKVTKTLVRLQSAKQLNVGDEIRADDPASGRVMGTVTSNAYSPALDSPLSLAILRRPHNEVGQQVQVSTETGNEVATVIDLASF